MAKGPLHVGAEFVRGPIRRGQRAPRSSTPNLPLRKRRFPTRGNMNRRLVGAATDCVEGVGFKRAAVGPSRDL
jgi:hypothetical protein